MATPIAAHIKGPTSKTQKFGKIKPFVDNPQPKPAGRPREEIVISDDSDGSPAPVKRRRNQRPIVVDSPEESGEEEVKFVAEKLAKAQKRTKRSVPEPVVPPETSEDDSDVVEIPDPSPPKPTRTRTGSKSCS